jgi:hypothetical protein
VLKGTKVTVEEVDDLKDNDLRMKQDRDVHVVLPQELKVAVKRISGVPATAGANVVTMCG